MVDNFIKGRILLYSESAYIRLQALLEVYIICQYKKIIKCTL